MPYTYPHWAYDVAIYGIYSGGNQVGEWIKAMDSNNGTTSENIQNIDYGMLAIYISTIILTCLLGMLVYKINVRLCKNPLIAFLTTMGILYLLKNFIAARAQLVSYILFALTILCIESFLETKKKRYLGGLVAISLVLANIHVAVWPFFFVLFLPYIAEYLIIAIVDFHILSRLNLIRLEIQKKYFEKKQKEEKLQEIEGKLKEKQEELQRIKQGIQNLREHPYRIQVTKNGAIKWLVLIMIICMFTGLLTPIGNTPYTYLLNTMEGNTTQSISEHLPLTLFNDKPTMLVFTLFLIILIFTDTKIKLSDLFMLAGLVYMSFMSRRQISLFVILCGFIFAKLMASLFEKYAPNISKKIIGYMSHILGKILTICIVLILTIVIYKPKAKNPFINKASYPVEASNFILENIELSTMRLYNEYNYGSYLLFRGIPVFIDSRADLYTPEFNGTKNSDKKRDIFSDYINISSIGTYYETKFEEYEITHVMCVKNAKLNMFLSRDNNYKELYSDNYFIIYERQEKGE